MARSIFAGLRRKRRSLAALLSYALLLNVLLAATINVQAIAAAIDPLSVAATCDSTGSDPVGGDPLRHTNQHQPDCTLCSPACPMGAMAQGLEDSSAIVAQRPSGFGLDISAQRRSSIYPPSIYVSDAAAQAPPAIG